MVCLFCIAVMGMLSAASVGATADAIASGLQDASKNPVDQVADSDSVAKFETVFVLNDRSVRVNLTYFKAQNRIRIQVVDHVLSPTEVHDVFQRIANAVGAEVVEEHTDPENEEPHEHDHEDDRETERERARNREPNRD